MENLFKKKNPLQDLLSSLNAVISTNESTRIITGHVIYNPAYTYKFQLKTTIVDAFCGQSGESLDACKVQIFWEGHKIWEKNLPIYLTLPSDVKKLGDFFWNFVVFPKYLNFNAREIVWG